MSIGVCDVLSPSGEGYPVVSASDVWYSDSSTLESSRTVILSYQLREADLKTVPLSQGAFASPLGIKALPDCPDVTAEFLYNHCLAGGHVSARIQVLRESGEADWFYLRLVSAVRGGQELTFESASHLSGAWGFAGPDCILQLMLSVPIGDFPTASLRTDVSYFVQTRIVPTQVTPVSDSAITLLDDPSFEASPDSPPRLWRSGRTVQFQIPLNVVSSDGSVVTLTSAKAVPSPVSEFSFVCPDLASMSSCATLTASPDGSLSLLGAVSGGAYHFTGSYLSAFS